MWINDNSYQCIILLRNEGKFIDYVYYIACSGTAAHDKKRTTLL